MKILFDNICLNKINIHIKVIPFYYKLTDIIDFVKFPSLSLESPSVVTLIQYVSYLYNDNKSGSIFIMIINQVQV